MSSALSITRAVNPPRAVYLDYPLGRTAGKPLDQALQDQIMRDTLTAFAAIETPGTIVPLAYEWQPDASWKDSVMRPRGSGTDQGATGGGADTGDDRVARFDSPQYQHSDDEARADPACASCVFLADPAT